MDLVLERRRQIDKTIKTHIAGDAFWLAPDVGEDYWEYRVRLSETQAVVGFPKFGVIGIGFAKEEEWNTNLPSDCATEAIFEHISGNKGDARITETACLEAIRMIQQAVVEDEAANKVYEFLDEADAQR